MNVIDTYSVLNRIAGVGNTLGNVMKQTSVINRGVNMGTFLCKVATPTAVKKDSYQKNFITDNPAATPYVHNSCLLTKIATAVANQDTAITLQKNIIEAIIGNNNGIFLNRIQASIFAQSDFFGAVNTFRVNPKISEAIASSDFSHTAKAYQQQIDTANAALELFQRNENNLRKRLLNELDTLLALTSSLDAIIEGKRGVAMSQSEIILSLADVNSEGGRIARERFTKQIERIQVYTRENHLNYRVAGRARKLACPAIFEVIQQRTKHDKRYSAVATSEYTSIWLKIQRRKPLDQFMVIIAQAYESIKEKIVDGLVDKVQKNLKKLVNHACRLRLILLYGNVRDIRYLLRTITRMLKIATYDGKDADNSFSFEFITRKNYYSNISNNIIWLTKRFSLQWWRLPSAI